MPINLPRKKKPNLFLKTGYLLKKFLPLHAKEKTRLFADLAWIFHRLAFEMTYQVYAVEDHPLRKNSFLFDKLANIESVLDVGCGAGDLASQIYLQCPCITAIDLSVQAITDARIKYPWINFIVGSAEQFPAASYDLIVLSHVLEHLDDPAGTLNNLKSKCSYIYIEVPDFNSDVLNQVRLDLASNLVYSDNDHVSEFTFEELRGILEDCKIKIIEAEIKYGFLKFWCRST